MSDDETYEVPLQDQRIFGAGIKRKRVKFVPSSSSSTAVAPSTTPAKLVSDFYLSLVLRKDAASSEKSTAGPDSPLPLPAAPADEPTTQTNEPPEPQLCDICSLPLSSSPVASADATLPQSAAQSTPKPRPHEASLAHQVCLTHSHPPSHLDRNRKGLAYLAAYGWDPDSRLGLGASGQGIQYPIKTKPKDDKLGIGVVVPPGTTERVKKVRKLDAGRARKMYEKDRREGQRLRDLFYRNEDVERYLGGG
jgi:hypothetical protein